jgi:hypothetical protein
MNALLLVMRVVHVLCGVFWAGALIFMALFLTPALRDAGPDGAKVGLGLQQRRLVDVMPLVAVLTVLSGLWLLWHLSGGFQPAFFHSGTGTAISLGAASALVALGIGLAVMRPAMVGAARIAQAAAAAAPGERDAHLAAAQRLRQRAATAGNVIAVLLAIAVVAMALARYL